MPSKAPRKRVAKSVPAAPLKKRASAAKAPVKTKAAPRVAAAPILPVAAAELSYTAPFESRISRLFIFRWLWIFIEMWVLIVWGLWIGIIRLLHFWYMLILGRRSLALWQKELRFFRHLAKWHAYWSYLVNKRPELIEP